MTFKPSCRAIIVGAGLGGLAAAIGIRKAGFAVLVLEKVDEIREVSELLSIRRKYYGSAKHAQVGAGIEVASNAARALNDLGILEKVMQYAIDPKDIVLRSYRDGSVLSRQNLIPYCMDKYGFPHFDVHRADLHRVLYEEALFLGVEIKLNAGVSEIDFARAEVRLSSGEAYSGSFIIGADGQNSRCREILLGRPDPPLRSGDLGFRIVLQAAAMRKRPELHSLMEPPNINAWFGPHSHVVSYLLQKDDLFNVFLGGPEKEGDSAIGPQEASIEELEARFKDWDPRLRSLLELAQETRKWTMFRGSDIAAWTSPEGSFALLGDAAHGMLPYLGQGAAQALEDAVALSALCRKCTRPSDLPRVLSLYERVRLPRATQVRRRSHAMRATHGFPDGAQQRERDRLMALAPFDGHPNAWADPVFQPWLWGHDAAAAAGQAWDAERETEREMQTEVEMGMEEEGRVSSMTMGRRLGALLRGSLVSAYVLLRRVLGGGLWSGRKAGDGPWTVV